METVSDEKLYKALSSKDPRYDGRFYVGVKTTGIYCRPICSARPKKENLRFYRSKAEAEKEGYRPCLRCRPDLSPMSPQWDGTAAVVRRALSIIDEGGLKTSTLPILAEKLGMTNRHLRRLFERHLGASPMEIILSKRLHFGRQLLTQTGLSVTEIALSSGFRSVRRFNDAFVKTYKKSPREFRKDVSHAGALDATVLELRIPYVAPYDWPYLLRYFRNHEVFGVDAVEGHTYFRHMRIGRRACEFEVAHDSKAHSLRVRLRGGDFSALGALVERTRHAFDLDHNPHRIELPGTLEKERGIRVPGAFDGFEAAIAIILGQRVSVEHARRNVRKVVETFGERVDGSSHPRLTHFFPKPGILAREDVASIGIPRTRADAVRELARGCLEGAIDLSKCCNLEETKRSLLQIKGIGPWTAEMIALRCLRDTDAYPATDLVLKQALRTLGFSPERLSPWRAYLALVLWKISLR